MRFATDTGGTFTDLIIEDETGHIQMFKAATVPSEPVKGVLDAFEIAARQFQIDRRTLLGRGDMFIHGTTHAINAIVTKKTAKTALLVTSGHPDILVLREGGRREPFNHAVPYPDPYIPRALTFEVPERVLASGEIRRPLDEAAVEAIADQLRQRGVEAVAVCLLWSVLHPAHERRVGEILAARLPGVPVTLSHQLNPALREYRRAISAALDASLKPLMNRYLAGLTQSMREAGFGGRILVLTSQGGMVDIDEVQRAPILAINSGPSMAPIAGARLAAADTPNKDAIIFDTGGTTFDVSLVRQGRVPFTHETWLGRPLQSDLTGFPSVDVRSIGAGGGSIAWVEEGRVLRVGPQSAGAVPGPACYAAGGQYATVTDAALVLGYIDPSFFLGGRIRLDRDAAMAAVQRDVASPFAMTLEAAASAIMSVWSENMVQAISDITVNQGIDPAQAVIVGGGGAAGLNALTIAERLGCEQLIIPEVGAALSAFGAAVSDIAREYRRVFVTSTAQFDRDGAAAIVADLCRQALAFADAAGAAAHDMHIDFLVEARYLHQVWEIDVAVEPDRLFGAGGVQVLSQAFHRAHEHIFAFSDPHSPIEVIAWRAAVRCPVGVHPDLKLAHAQTPAEMPQWRRAFFPQSGWVEVPVLAFGDIEPNRRIDGPAIVESPFTSIVIDTGAAFIRSVNGNLVVSPGSARGASEQTYAAARGRP
ncbi:MAG: hydantoinase/oxoprolinase family protein [Xanthobacteraceae bacterium]